MPSSELWLPIEVDFAQTHTTRLKTLPIIALLAAAWSGG
jgi:hypothetical protein